MSLVSCLANADRIPRRDAMWYMSTLPPMIVFPVVVPHDDEKVDCDEGDSEEDPAEPSDDPAA